MPGTGSITKPKSDTIRGNFKKGLVLMSHRKKGFILAMINQNAFLFDHIPLVNTLVQTLGGIGERGRREINI